MGELFRKKYTLKKTQICEISPENLATEKKFRIENATTTDTSKPEPKAEHENTTRTQKKHRQQTPKETRISRSLNVTICSSISCCIS